MRITAPPIRHPCHYGIDMSTREEMVAHERTEAEIAAELGADSLAYLSLDGVYEAIRGSRENHCDACFTGEYPLARTARGSARTRSRSASARPGVTRQAPCGTAATPHGGEPIRTGAYGRSPVSTAMDTLTLPGLGPPPPEPVARARDADGALHELFGFAGVPAGPARGGRGRARRPRRARRHADRLGQVALLPAAGAHAGRPDGRRLAAGLAHAGPGRGARARRARPRRADQRPAGRGDATARCSTRAAAGQLRLLYVAPERFASPGFLERIRARADRAVRRRRGALRLPVGPRLPARLLPARRRRALARRRGDRRLDRDGDAAGGGGHRRAARAARSRSASPPASTGRTCRSRSSRCAAKDAGAPRRSPPRCASRARCRRSSTRARARTASGSPARLGRELGVEALAYHAGLPREARARGAAALHVRRRAGRRRDERVRHGRRQGRRADGRATRACRARSRPTTRRPAAPAATARRRAACCSPRAATRACTCSSSSARR